MRELLRAVFKTGTGSAASLVLGMIAMKIMAVVTGPGGVGLFSLLRQTQQTALSVANLSGQMAIVQGVASREGKARTEYLTTVMWILSVTGGLVGLAFLAFAPQIARWVTGHADPDIVVMMRWLSLTIVLGVVYSYLTGLLNGHRAIGRVALVQVANFGTMALLAYPFSLLMKAGHPLAFTWLLTASALVTALLALYFALQAGWLPWLFNAVPHSFNRASARHFLYLAGTMLISGFIGTLVPLTVRAITARQFGLAGVGVFEVAWTLSMAYVALILTSFSTYYLPTLSQTMDRVARADLIRRVSRLSTLLMVPLVVTVIALKPLVVRLLYSEEFVPSLEIIRWMLIGDYLKVTSWVFSFTMVAYADMKTFLWTEILWGGLTLCSAVVAIQGMNLLEGVGIGFMILYLTYLAYTLHYVRSRHQLTLDRPAVMRWLGGLGLVCLVSVQTWNDTQVNWGTAWVWVVAALSFSWLGLRSSERGKLKEMLLRRFAVSIHSQYSR